MRKSIAKTLRPLAEKSRREAEASGALLQTPRT